jgi:hypothetical protein
MHQPPTPSARSMVSPSHTQRGSYLRLCVDKQVIRISRGAAEVLAAELLGAIGKAPDDALEVALLQCRSLAGEAMDYGSDCNYPWCHANSAPSTTKVQNTSEETVPSSDESYTKKSAC